MNKNLITSSIQSPLGLGTSNLASLGQRMSISKISKLFQLALENDINLIDTADTYGSGDAERVIGKVLYRSRDKYFISTKAGFPYIDLPGIFSPLNQIGKKYLKLSGKKNIYSKKYLLSALHKSLNRLKTDYVDAFYLHEPSGLDLEINDDIWDALNDIKRLGMAKYVGLSTNDILAIESGILNYNFDILQTSMPYHEIKNDLIFKKYNSSSYYLLVNQVLKLKNSILLEDAFRILLRKYGKSEKDIYSILISYSYYYKKVDGVLIGTKNIEHLIENSIQYKINFNLTEIFEFIDQFYL
jgi:pyridoxine 4-dehydrogenase